MFDCSRIPLKDKGCHLIAGFVITLIVGLMFSVLYGVIAGAVAGLAKELYDEWKKRRGEHPVGFDWFDLFATLLGTWVGGAVVVLVS